MPQNTRLDRTVSMNTDNTSSPCIKKKTVGPLSIGRAKSLVNTVQDLERLQFGYSPCTTDDLEILFFEKEPEHDELSFKIFNDNIRKTILDNMRIMSKGEKILLDIESCQAESCYVDQLLSNWTKTELNLTFLWCAFLKKLDLLEVLDKQGVDIDFTLPGVGLSALHLSALSGCARCTWWLIMKGYDINLMPRLFTPLHCAVLGNSTETTKVLLRHGADLKDTVLHSAIRVNAVECLSLLMCQNVDVNFLDNTGKSPLHIASDRRMKQCLKVLLDCSKTDVNLENKEKNTALHLASEGGYADCLSMLIAKGAIIDKRNVKMQTPLHLAAKCQDVECVEILLKSGADFNAKDADNITPLRAAVGKKLLAYNTLETLLSWGADVNVTDKYGYSALHVAALNKLSQCVDALIMKGADLNVKNKGGVTPLSIIRRRTPACLTTICKKLDSSVSFHDPEELNKEAEVKLNFRYLLQNSSYGECGLLKTFIDEGQKKMLEHPVCEAFLCLKWQKIRSIYFARLFLYSVFVIFFTLYVTTALVDNCYNAAKNISQSDQELCLNNSLVQTLSISKDPHVIELTWYILVIFTGLVILQTLLSLPGYRSVREYFFHWSNTIEWFTMFSVFATSFVYTGQTHIWQNYVGAFGVLCAWTILMIIIGQHPSFGTYVAMFAKVQAEFAKLFLAYVFLLIGFTISFCVIFPMSQVFRNPLIGFVKVMVMMAGGLDMEMLIRTDSKNIVLNISAHIIFVLFLLLVTIVLMNMSVGVAVNDIQELHKTARLSKLVRQTKFFFFVETILFQGFVPDKIVDLLKGIVLVSPSAYRVVFHVKPLNPHEIRLPKHILSVAYEVAQKRIESSTDVLARISTFDNSDYLKKGYKTLTDEDKILKEMLQQQQEIISYLLQKIGSKDKSLNGFSD